MLMGALALSGPARAQTVSRLIVSPMQLRLEQGTQRTVSADAFDARDNVVQSPEARPTFTSADTLIVRVSAAGEVRALQPGRTEIVVRSGSLTRRVVVTVSPAPARAAVIGTPPPVTAPVDSGPAVVGATILPAAITLLPTERLKPVLRVRFADGTVTDASAVSWTTFGVAIAFDSVGRDVIGIAPGSGVLGARTAHGITVSVPVTVGEPALSAERDSLVLVSGERDTARLVATGQGRRLVTQNLSWRTTDPDVVRVTNQNLGAIEARAPGTADLVVDGYGVTRRVPVRVAPRIAQVKASVPHGTSIELASGLARSIDVEFHDANGASTPDVVRRWSIADTSIASVSERGEVEGRRAGATILVLKAVGADSVHWPVLVRGARVSLGAPRTVLASGRTVQLSAALVDTLGRSAGEPTTRRWTTSRDDIVTVDGAGRLTARRIGRAVVTVDAGRAGIDSTTVFVTGDLLLFGVIDGVQGVWHLVDGDSVLVPFLLPDSSRITQVEWAPDGKRLAVVTDTRDAVGRLVIVDPDGANPLPTGSLRKAYSDPSWLPGTARLLAVAREGNKSAVEQLVPGDTITAELASIKDVRLGRPVAGPDSASAIVNWELKGAADVFSVGSGAMTPLMTSRAREQVLGRLRDGRLLVAFDSTGRMRLTTLAAVAVASNGTTSATPLPVPPGSQVIDAAVDAAGETVFLVARVRSWGARKTPSTVILAIPISTGMPRLLLTLREKDSVSVKPVK